VVASSGDTAYLYDSPGRDTFAATPSLGRLVGGLADSGPIFDEQAWGFKTVVGLSKAGGADDIAYLYDTAGNNTVAILPGTSAAANQASLVGSGLFEQALGFPTVAAIHSAGSFDVAYLYDAPGNDTFVATSTYAILVGSGLSEQAYGFAVVAGIHSAGGMDVAYLYASLDNSSFVATPTYAAMSGAGYNIQAFGFAAVAAFGGGNDTAVLYGSAGNDTFSGTPPGFPDFTALTDSLLVGSGFQLQTLGFQTVNVIGNGGSDTAYLYAKSGANTFVGSGHLALLSEAGYALNLQDFANVVASAYPYIGGTSRKVVLSPLDYTFTALGNWS
jgi:hypothetical protein